MARGQPKPPLPAGAAAKPRRKGMGAAGGEMMPKKRTLADVMREFPTGEEWIQLQKELSAGADMTVAILMTAQLERYLEFAMLVNFPRIEKAISDKLIAKDGPLASLHAKTWLAYAMGLIDEPTRDDIDIIRRVRNAFAHSAIRVAFRMPEIIEECAKLNRVSAPLKALKEGESPLLGIPHSRYRFSDACSIIAVELMQKTADAARRKALAKELLNAPVAS